MSETGTIDVKVLFFGATADVVSKRAVTLEVPSGTISEDAFRRVLELYPELASHKLLFAVNQSYSTGSERLNDNDELAVFTAVSGG